jgi:hypothetical protein
VEWSSGRKLEPPRRNPAPNCPLYLPGIPARPTFPILPRPNSSSSQFGSELRSAPLSVGTQIHPSPISQINQTINHSVNQTINNPSINYSIINQSNQSTNQSIHQPLNQPINPLIKPSNQSPLNHQPIHQSINQNKSKLINILTLRNIPIFQG